MLLYQLERDLNLNHHYPLAQKALIDQKVRMFQYPLIRIVCYIENRSDYNIVFPLIYSDITEDHRAIVDIYS